MFFLVRVLGNNVTSGDANVVIGTADVASATGADQLSISDGNKDGYSCLEYWK